MFIEYPHFIRLLSELLNLIGRLGKIKSFEKSLFLKNCKYVESNMFMVFATSLVVFLAHLSKRLIGELIGYSWSGVRPSSSVRRPS